jgi:hypothetical protein
VIKIASETPERFIVTGVTAARGQYSAFFFGCHRYPTQVAAVFFYEASLGSGVFTPYASFFVSDSAVVGLGSDCSGPGQADSAWAAWPEKPAGFE